VQTGGYCHFPSDRDSEWYKQITAEKLVTRYVKGQPVREWHKPDRARNEALDCRVYATAALKIMQPSFKRLAERLIPAESAANDNKKPAKRAEKPAPKPAAKPLENPQEEGKPAAAQTKPIIKRTKSAEAARHGRGSWAKNW
jgi:phage terminase large subunit GpA-like protein